MNQNLNKYIFSTPNIYNDEEAVELKMKQIHPKLFGLFCPVRYECIKKEKVYVVNVLVGESNFGCFFCFLKMFRNEKIRK